MPDHVDPEACPDCACPLADHVFGQAWIDYAASIMNDYPGQYGDGRRVSPCLNCDCGRDPMIEAA